MFLIIFDLVWHWRAEEIINESVPKTRTVLVDGCSSDAEQTQSGQTGEATAIVRM